MLINFSTFLLNPFLFLVDFFVLRVFRFVFFPLVFFLLAGCFPFFDFPVAPFLFLVDFLLTLVLRFVVFLFRRVLVFFRVAAEAVLVDGASSSISKSFNTCIKKHVTNSMYSEMEFFFYSLICFITNLYLHVH